MRLSVQSRNCSEVATIRSLPATNSLGNRRRPVSGRLRNIEKNQIMSRLFFVFAPFLAFAWAQSGHADSENQLFYDAVRAEAAKDFDSAIRLYEQSAKKSHSANLYGNLANLYFKKEMFGRSILNYRKALLLAPENRDFAANLSFVRETARIQSSSLDSRSSYLYFGRRPVLHECLDDFYRNHLLGRNGGNGIDLFYNSTVSFKSLFFSLGLGLTPLARWASQRQKTTTNCKTGKVSPLLPPQARTPTQATRST